ncbi:hypothetical protein LTR86_002055 [Recurvomyces mirabilis]|nr:hypothetical protein LTR86_002055 [Recurvomyces mirabilis]
MRRSARISTLSRERAVTPDNSTTTTTRSRRTVEELSEPLTPIGRTVDIWYDLWSTKRLHEAITQRTGKDPGPLERPCSVRRLVKLDQEWTFHRFWDLPKELRFAIYAKCLELRPSKTSGLLTCYPNILQTSSGIHKVAQPMLYTVNTFEIKIKSTAYPVEANHPANITAIEFSRLDHPIETLKDAPMEDIDEVWPGIFSKISSIRLVLRLVQGVIKHDDDDEDAEEEQDAGERHLEKDVETDDDDDDDDEADSSDYDEADTDADDVEGEEEEEDDRVEDAKAGDEDEEDVAPDSYQQLNHILHSLLALPMLKNLHIVVRKCPEHVSGELLESILHPVSQLAHSRGARLTFEGVPMEVATILESSRALMRKTPSHHTLVSKLRDEVIPARGFYERVAASERANGIVRLLANVIHEAEECSDTLVVYFDSPHYNRCNTALTALRSCLASAAFRDLETKIRDQRSTARTSYSSRV